MSTALPGYDVVSLTHGRLMFKCPGCKTIREKGFYGNTHAIPVGYIDERPPTHTRQWNGNVLLPTIEGPNNVRFEVDGKEVYCHFEVKDGRISFLSDSTHKLAGKTVKLRPWYQRNRHGQAH